MPYDYVFPINMRGQRAEPILSCSPKTSVSSLTHDNLATLSDQRQTQLKAWARSPQRYEQIGVGEKTSTSSDKKQKWLSDVEKKINGKGA